MEEEKVVDPAQRQKSEESVFWQWKLGPNPDPWAGEDPAKWTWQDYSNDDCRVIEDAFLLNKDIVDLKDYEIDLKRMRQVNKKFRTRIRRVRRQECSRFMMEMSEPVPIVKNEKTMNEAFGTIQHFLDYIMKRTPEAYGLYQRLSTLMLSLKNHLFQDVIQEVIASIEKGAETREKVIKTRSGCQKKNYINEAKKIVDLIKMNSTTLGDFLKVILQVYTMETFICYWLNELLRSENWEEINVLTPYLVCLVYTFKLSEYVVEYQKPQGFVNSLLGFVIKPKLYLYRGAAFTEEHLKLYDPKKIQYFSWNGVTSTSKDKHIAYNFARASLKKAQELNESKVGVLFKIENDFASPEDCEGIIDVSQDSRYPEEQEIILAPGTVFKLQQIRLIEDDIYEISLKVTKKFDETKKNIALLGTLQDQAILKDKAIITGLPSQQSFRLLELLKGNKLIGKLEIRNSGIEEHMMEEIENLRLTTNVKREDVKLVKNTIVIGNLSLFVHYYSPEKLNEIFISNLIRFKDGEALKNKKFEIKTLFLNEETLKSLKMNNQLRELSKKMKDLSGLEYLELSIREIEAEDDQFFGFLRDIKGIMSLKELRIKGDENHAISRDGFEIFCQTIGGSKILRHDLRLTLSTEALGPIESTLLSIAFLQNLSLCLKFDKRISNKELNYLKFGLKPFIFLQHLSLDFRRCGSISNEGLDCLGNGLTSLISIQHLSLNFEGCSKISDEGLNYLTSALRSLTSLQYLSLDFEGCDEISDEGLNYLRSALLSLTSLQYLLLNLKGCYKISERERDHLRSKLKFIRDLNFSE